MRDVWCGSIMGKCKAERPLLLLLGQPLGYLKPHAGVPLLLTSILAWKAFNGKSRRKENRQ